MPNALRVRQEPGDAVMFNACGLHRGRYHVDKLRRTLMLTYSRMSTPTADYFTTQPWFLEAGYLNGLKPNTRAFYEKFIAQFQNHWAPAQAV